jgi:hypothetical protein
MPEQEFLLSEDFAGLEANVVSGSRVEAPEV